jgi:hypothetical protein
MEMLLVKKKKRKQKEDLPHFPTPPFPKYDQKLCLHQSHTGASY